MESQKLEECLLCSVQVNESSSKDFPCCPQCYKIAHKADMTLARNLVFKAADHIIDNIYLGSECSTIDLEYMNSLNIKRILTVAAHCDHLKHFDQIEYKVLDVDDSPSEDSS